MPFGSSDFACRFFALQEGMPEACELNFDYLACSGLDIG